MIITLLHRAYTGLTCPDRPLSDGAFGQPDQDSRAEQSAPMKSTCFISLMEQKEIEA